MRKSLSSRKQRVNTIRNKYGADAFRKWGKGTPSRPGGNPVLLAQGRRNNG